MKKICILAVTLFCLLFSSITSVKPRFSMENNAIYTFYCGSTSSSARIISCSAQYAAIYRVGLGRDVTGESTVYTNRTYQEILEEYGAAVLFTEETAGVKNYYCFANDMAKTVVLQGQNVNLHIAVRSDGTLAVGTPLIFGGF